MSIITDNQLKGYIDTVFLQYDINKTGYLTPSQLVDFFNDIFLAMGSQKRFNEFQVISALKSNGVSHIGPITKHQLFVVLRHILGYKMMNQPTISPSMQNYENQQIWGNKTINQGFGNQNPLNQTQNTQNQVWSHQNQNEGFQMPSQNQGPNIPSQNQPLMGQEKQQYSGASYQNPQLGQYFGIQQQNPQLGFPIQNQQQKLQQEGQSGIQINLKFQPQKSETYDIQIQKH